MGLDIPNEVMLYIANQIDSNIRELEGALIRVVAYSSLVNKDITTDLAAEALKDIIPNARPRIITILRYPKGSRRAFSHSIRRFYSEKTNKIDCISTTSCNVSYHES